MNSIEVRIAVAGSGGRMGRKLIQATRQMDGVVLGAALERMGSPLLGLDVGELIGGGKIGIIVQSSLRAVINDFDVLIDFTRPDGTLKYLEFCRQHGKAMVIGTTGFDEAGKAAIKTASKEIAIVFASNFSIGMSIMLRVLEKVTKTIGNHSDIEVIEAHHRYKADVPSGTALAIGEEIARAMDKDLESCVFYVHKGQKEKRPPGTISFSSIRAGDIIGEHTVIFADTGERLEITHKASSRITFAKGAVKSALWVFLKKNGLFNIKDIFTL